MDRTPYRAAVRLYGLAEHYWAEIDAEYIHIDLLDLPAYRLLNVIHTWFTRHMKPEDREMFEARLEEPLPFEKAVDAAPSRKALASEANTFLAAQRIMGG